MLVTILASSALSPDQREVLAREAIDDGEDADTSAADSALTAL
jgi:hypothetical protein